MTKFKNILLKLQEDAKQDKKWRKEARDIYKKMIEYLKNGGEIRVIKNFRDVKRFNYEISLDDFYTIDKWEMKSHYNPLSIRFYSYRKNKGVNGDHNPLRVAPMMNIYCLKVDELLYRNNYYSSSNKSKILSSEEFKNDLRDHTVEMLQPYSNFYNTFIHEMIHHIDFRRSGLSKTEWLNDKHYYKKDKEVNAFFQEFLDNYERKIEKGQSLSQKYFNKFKNNFKEFKEWVFRVKLKSFQDNLDDDQYKRLVNRLYDFWKEYLQDYEVGDTTK